MAPTHNGAPPQVEFVKAEKLAGADYNPRRIDKRQLEALATSLREDPRFFLQRPCLVNRRADGQLVVYAGNMRLAAAKANGQTMIPCLIETIPIEQEKVRNLKDNNAYGEYVDAELAGLVYGLTEGGQELSTIGFSPRELSALYTEGLIAAGGTPPADEVPEPPVEAVSKRGEVYQLGPHRLMCGDSTKIEDVLALMQGETAQLFATDPPYLVDYTGKDRPGGGHDWSDDYHEVDIKDAEGFLRSVFTHALVVIDEHAAIYCWHSHRRVALIARIWHELDLLLHQQIIWVKPAALMTFAFYPWRHEPCLMGWRRGHKPAHFGMRKGLSSVWVVGLERPGDPTSPDYYTDLWELDWEGRKRNSGGLHPTTKPVGVFEIPMRVHTKVGELCYEPFSGSGSQLIAAERLQRKCYAMEIEPRFVDVARDRYAIFTREPRWAARPADVMTQLQLVSA